MCACVRMCVCIHVCIFHVDGYHKLPAGYDFHATCLISSSARGREVLSPDTTEAPSQASYHEQYVKKMVEMVGDCETHGGNSHGEIDDLRSQNPWFTGS